MSTRSIAASTRGWMSCCVRPTTRRLPMMMTDVDRLLRDYIERFESGGSVDPNDLLEQLDAADRRKLSVLIEGYLEHGAKPRSGMPRRSRGPWPVALSSVSRPTGSPTRASWCVS